jgi:hypothetical protein
MLGIQPAVSDAPLLERPDHLRKGVALLAPAKAGVAELPELWRFQPIRPRPNSRVTKCHLG